VSHRCIGDEEERWGWERKGAVEIMCSLAAQRRIFFAGDEAAIAISIWSILGRRGDHWKNEEENRVYTYLYGVE
jgi:hypothetical protein